MASCTSLLFTTIIIIIIAFPVSTTAQQSSNRNVTLGSYLIADAATNSTWTSPSGEFAFGFQMVAPGAFLLAIWFDKIPEKTLIWSANRDAPVPAGSRVQLSEDRVLELVDPTSRRVWANPDPALPGTVAYAAMLDTGNFVLASSSGARLWQSFDSPTDTLLPDQILKGSAKLVSTISDSNYSSGRFQLTIDGDNVGLHTRNFPMDDSVYQYWRDTGLKLIFNQSGSIYTEQGYTAQGVGVLINLTLDGGAVSVNSFLQRLTLDYDGVLRQYVYPKSANSTAGRTAWSVHDFIPQDICTLVKTGFNGGGICGFNTLCSTRSATDGRTVCECVKGHSQINPADPMGGCKPDFAAQSCDDQSLHDGAYLFEFAEYFNTNWPYSDYQAFVPVDEDFCRRDCLADCYCVAAVYYNERCHKKALPLINGRTEPSSLGIKSIVKVRRNYTVAPRQPPKNDSICASKSSSSTTLVVTLSLVLGSSVLLHLLSSVFFVFHFKNGKKAVVSPAGVNLIRSFSFKELQEATNDFRDELGRGACSVVYRGALKKTDEENGTVVVAVKKLNKIIVEEADVEFTAEVSSISRTNHKNLVKLVGYCDEWENRILVYEFMRNGSLATFLFQKHSPRPNWYTRVQIAFAIARGLCYLHEDCSVPIIHCDIKPQNVLLDESFTPKIADFGLAKRMKADQTRTNTGIRGTKGYVAPEWFRNMAITVKVDVYSFGILLLELLCCRRNYEAEVEDEGEAVLADWAYDCYQQGALDVLVAGDEEAKSDMKMLEVFVKTAIWCIQEDPSMRPHMKRVMRMLEGSIQVPAPPNPTTFIS